MEPKGEKRQSIKTMKGKKQWKKTDEGVEEEVVTWRWTMGIYSALNLPNPNRVTFFGPL